MTMERRVVGEPMEVRKADGKPTRLAGYAAVFNREAVIGGFFREQIAPGAFTRAMKEDDVRALFNHDPNFVLGRTTSKTLSLSADERGLHYDITPPETQWASDLMTSVSRGDVTQSSFGFQVLADTWTHPETRGDLPLRTITEAKLYDVSPVTYPAYEETTAEARAQASEVGFKLARLAGVVRGMTEDEEAEDAAELVQYMLLQKLLGEATVVVENLIEAEGDDTSGGGMDDVTGVAVKMAAAQTATELRRRRQRLAEAML